MVYLVGAGPGDPELITVKGLRVLREADVVLFDRLANPILLNEAPTGAIKIDVGKRPRDPNQPRQEWINELLVEHGQKGGTVVRLKGGDPYVYGRGFDELEALRSAGIPAEVIPGITSAIAAPAAAGIPVTHRSLANAFAVFTGHEVGDSVPWSAAVQIPTVVFLMGVERLPVIVAELLRHGRPPETPVAVVQSGTLPEQVLVQGTLGDIVDRAKGIQPPAVIVVGEVAAL